MSKDQAGTPCVSISRFKLVKSIVTFFKLGEEGKIEKFFEKERKTLSRFIATLKTNNSVLKQSHENSLEDYKERMEDAHTAVEDAYMNVDADRVSNNHDAANFSNQYWDRIMVAEANILTLEESVKDAKEVYEALVAKNDKQIVEANRRLTRISAEA